MVAVWLGHSESVSAKHYTQVRPEDFAAAVGRTTDPQTDPKASENPGTRGTGKTANPEKTCVFPGSAVEFGGIRAGGMLRQGFEPPRENTGKTLAERVFDEVGGAPGGAIGNDRPEVGVDRNVEAIKAALAALSPAGLAEVLAAIQSGAGMR